MHVAWLHSNRPIWEMIWKNILSIWFSHFTWTETHRWSNFSVSLYFNKKRQFPMRSVLTHLVRIKTFSKLLDYRRKSQNYVRIDTYYCKPKLISWRWINILAFDTRFLSPTIQKCADLSTYWPLFYYRPPGKFRYTTETIAKIRCQEVDIYR